VVSLFPITRVIPPVSCFQRVIITSSPSSPCHRGFLSYALSQHLHLVPLSFVRSSSFARPAGRIVWDKERSAAEYGAQCGEYFLRMHQWVSSVTPIHVSLLQIIILGTERDDWLSYI
jgi:hypothetical protein